MTEQIPLPSLDQLKRQARRLRAQIEVDGVAVSHSKSLELLAHQYGYKNWKTLHAAVGNRPQQFVLSPGARVSGRYLGHPFEATVKAVGVLNQARRMRVTLDFDEPVDVIRFEGWSAFRNRVSANVMQDGRSVERISDGTPVMAIDL